jgi:hypothetical protein
MTDALVEETALDMVCLALMFFFSGLYTTVSFSIEEELHADFLLYIFSNLQVYIKFSNQKY